MITSSLRNTLTDTLYPAPMPVTTRISVILPVKDEAAAITSTLDALRLQTDPGGVTVDPQTYEVLVLVNNTTDNSLNMIRNYADMHPSFQLHAADIWLDAPHAHVGTVRRKLMDEAYQRFRDAGIGEGIIASTDGDSQVGAQWIYHILREMNKGNDVVSGRILAKSDNSMSRLYHLRDVSYRMLVSKLESQIDPAAHDPWPRHFQCFGPSVAVRMSVYEKAGRLPAIPALEDEEFRKALHRIDARVRRSPDVKVYTSSRLCGKVPFGFSTQLQQWAAMQIKGESVFVEALPALMIRFKLRKYLRARWMDAGYPQTDEGNMLISLCQLDEHWLGKALGAANYFGTLWEEIEETLLSGSWLHRFPMIPINAAIAQLRNYLKEPSAPVHPAGNRLSADARVIAS